MRRWKSRTWMCIAFTGLLALGTGGSAPAATLDFTGALSISFVGATFVIPGAGVAQAAVDGGSHLLSLSLAGGTFGPITTSTVIPAGTPYTPRLTGVGNLSGSFAAISGGPPGGGAMGVTGSARVCVVFGGCVAVIPIPVAATTNGGFGIGGMQVTSAGGVTVTAQHAPWTLGQPVLTIHTPASAVTTPLAPGGFAHGPASLTSSTAQPSGVMQLVTVTKAFTSLTAAWPEFPVIGVLTLHFVPEPGTLLLLGSGAAVLAVYGRRKRGR